MSKRINKTKAQLVAEMEALQAELETTKARWQQAEIVLRESEERYQCITQTMANYVYRVRIEHGQAVETAHGPACVAVTGYTSEDYAANPNLWLQMVDEEDRPAVLEQAQQLLGGHPAHPLEHRITHKDGTKRWIRNTPIPHIDPEGNLLAYDGLIQDITERKQVEEELRLTQFCIDRALVGIMRTGPDAEIQSANDHVCRSLGYTREELCNMYVYDIDPDFPVEKWSEHRQNLRIQGSDTFETTHRRKDGTTYPVEITATHLDFRGGDYSFSFVHDITERKHTEQTLHLTQFCLERASIGIMRLGSDGRIQSVNEQFCRNLGYTREELCTMSVTDIAPGLSIEAWLMQLQDLRVRGSRTFEAIHQRKDGTLFPVEIRSTYLRYRDEDFSFSFVSDITDRKQAEEALEQERNLLRTLIDSMPDHIYAKDIEGRFTLKNKADALAMGASSPSEVIGKTDFDYYPREIAERFHADDQQVIRSGQPLINREELNIDAKGTKHWILTTKVPLSDSRGKVMGLVGIGRDITERKRVEEELDLHREHLEELVEQRTAELKAANEQLRMLSNIKDEFVSNVSHELRTPLSSIKLRQHLAQHHPDQLDEHLGVINRETDRLAHTIEDLLQLSRLDQRRTEFRPLPLDLNHMVEQYVADRMPVASGRYLTLSFQAEPELPQVTADAGLLGQVLSILLTNAINYTPAKGQVTVRTHSRQDAGRRWAGFSISDTGPGISPKEQSQLFTRFFRGTAARKSGTPGTGLGLSIAKEIVSQHGGKIEVASSDGPECGTIFSVWIPIKEKTNEQFTDS
ncbi:MAG: PAS domain S-box protein [Anaerolineae bacterium]|nr:PAS domain S-box protein [Anaerolineae bacterium]